MQPSIGTTTKPVAVDLRPLDMARLRQALYRFWAILFLYPEASRLSNVSTAVTELTAAKDAWQPLEFGDKLSELLRALAVLNVERSEVVEEEYNDLFRVKPAAPPYESFYIDRDGQMRGKLVGQLENEYVSAGLIVSPTLRDLPDHVAVELEFMSFLCGNEVEARHHRRQEDNVQSRLRQRRFLQEHMALWFPKFARRLADARPDGFYAAIVAATYAFLRHDLAYLGLHKAS